MPAKDIGAYSFETARDELLTIVARLEEGNATLDEALELWERGEKLAARCQEILDGARERIAAVRGVDTDVEAAEDGE
ncbi:MAG: exodeoxyribonuclease VII small subunit [Demequina sp.]|jgi:exodeoxyribonuclease VII small subunit|nr:exodeoxyribonuclease VII small subunit [Demequina sp.]